MRLGVSLRHRIQLTPTGDEPVIKTYVSVHILSGREKERVQIAKGEQCCSAGEIALRLEPAAGLEPAESPDYKSGALSHYATLAENSGHYSRS